MSAISSARSSASLLHLAIQSSNRGGGGSPNGQAGGQSQIAASPLLAALQKNSSGNFSLTDIFQQPFQNFPNGTGLDVKI